MPRNMVIGKLKYLIGPARGTLVNPPGRSRFYFCPDVRVQSGRTSRGGYPVSMDWRRKGKNCVGDLVLIRVR